MMTMAKPTRSKGDEGYSSVNKLAIVCPVGIKALVSGTGLTQELNICLLEIIQMPFNKKRIGLKLST